MAKERNGKYILGWIMATTSIRDISLLPFMASSDSTYRLDSYRRNPSAYMVEHRYDLKVYNDITKGHLDTVLKEEEKRKDDKGEKRKEPNNKRPRTDEQETAAKDTTATVTTSLAELQLQ